MIINNKENPKNVIAKITLKTLIRSISVITLFFNISQSFNKSGYSNTKNNKSFIAYYSYKQRGY
jgi:hypothetical protein